MSKVVCRADPNCAQIDQIYRYAVVAPRAPGSALMTVYSAARDRRRIARVAIDAFDCGASIRGVLSATEILSAVRQLLHIYPRRTACAHRVYVALR